MKKTLLLTCLMLMGMFLSVSADTTGSTSGSVKVGSTERTYLQYVPTQLGAKRPLLISCHGMNQDPSYQKNMLKIESVADTAKFVTVFPQGENNSWDISGRKDINFILKIIDKMVEQYDIDPGRVYLSGFSMGGMFTYHAMNLISDRIAAFAPISGYTMNGVTANADARAIPIIHTHGTVDDVVTFNNVQANLNVWINHNHCNTTPTVTASYRGANHITRRVWSGGDDGVEVVLMEMAGKGHWISNDNGVLTGDEIWKFCSRYRIDVERPYVAPVLEPDRKFTSVQEIGTTPFALINEAEEKAIFCPSNQNLDYQDYETAFNEGNSGYLFTLESSTVGGCYLLHLITPGGTPYSIWGSPGYLNGYSSVADCSFILGLNGQNGQDVVNGAVWEIDCVDGKGFTLKNKYTGKYLHNAFSAKYDDPAFFTFCTLKAISTDMKLIRNNGDSENDAVYDLHGRRVNENSLRPGIYIKDRRKIVIR